MECRKKTKQNIKMHYRQKKNGTTRTQYLFHRKQNTHTQYIQTIDFGIF